MAKKGPEALRLPTSLLDFIPAISPRWKRPDHLTPLTELFERIARGEVIRALVSVPPQFGKTETELHAIAWLLKRFPDWPIAFAGYSAPFSHSKSRTARDYALAAGVELRSDSTAVHEWTTKQGGGLRATSIGGPLTGHPVRVLLVDDPHKDRAEAESSATRNRVHDWFRTVGLTRMHPQSSAIIVHTRWHPNDLIGHLASQNDPGDPGGLWEIVNLPAISEDGRSLWEAERPVSFLERRKKDIGEFEWASLYMGQPRPRGANVFSDVHFYDELPKAGYRVGIGVDLAYTAKTHADFSVAVSLLVCDGTYYVTDLRRKQCAPPEFAAELRTMAAASPGARMLWYTSTTERGLADLLRSESKLPIVGEIASADKFVRAQPAAAAWNAGKILLPRDAPWTHVVASEVCSFTGVNDRHDDIVDALAAAFDVLDRGAGLAKTKAIKSAFTPFGAPGRWRRGQVFPPAYRAGVVDDYYRYHLRRPPPGSTSIVTR